MSILVKRLFAYNNLRNFTYIISTDEGEAWVIDPYDAGQVKNEIRRLGVKLKGILNTHSHDDHTRGNQELQDYFKCEVLSFFLNRSIKLDQNHTLEVLDTPGHTPDHLVFLWKQNGIYQMIFAGDTLFNAGVGNCKNGGNIDELFETTLMLKNKLSQEVALQPGHDYLRRNLEFALKVEPNNKHISERLYQLNNIETELLPPATIKEELLVNPFFRLGSEEIRKTWLSTEQLSLGDEVIEKELFKKLRTMRDNW